MLGKQIQGLFIAPFKPNVDFIYRLQLTGVEGGISNNFAQIKYQKDIILCLPSPDMSVEITKHEKGK